MRLKTISRFLLSHKPAAATDSRQDQDTVERVCDIDPTTDTL